MPSERVAIVTGGNKGIGYAIVKGLCKKFDGFIYLTARDIARGESAVGELKKLGCNTLFHQLDIDDQDSVDKFRNYIKETYGGIDILVNNAGMAFTRDASEPLAVQAEVTLKTNYFGTLRVCEALFPLLRNNAKVVNISSVAGHLKSIPSTLLKEKFKDPNLSIDGLTQLMNKFIEDAKNNNTEKEGWGKSCYAVSKVGVSALSILQQRKFDRDQPNRNIFVNHVHPGYVDTDMTNHNGPLTIEEGAQAPLFLALEADFKGQYVWYDCQIVDWFGNSTPTLY